jgi:phospho-N-acetylmuramoyl-pentapeptide-transferase
MTQAIQFITAFLISLVVTFVLEKKFIPALMRIKMGQFILDIGPRWHKSKEGTPTMGGIFFIAGITIAFLAGGLYSSIRYNDYSSIIVLVCAILFGAIGFVDDYTKFVKKQNKGLSAKSKLILQFVVSALLLFFMKKAGYITTAVDLPFSDKTLELGIAYYIISFFFIAFIVNSVNLTDGIDGLAGSVTLIVSILFSAIAFKTFDLPSVSLMGAVVGGLCSFLYYNINPAKIFMGDTGSLFLGGLVVGAAYKLNCPLIILFAGLWYVIEALSVVLQVLSFKLFKKRIFKMSPIHHHFEMCSWSEHKIVRAFSLFTAVMCVIGYIAFIN